MWRLDRNKYQDAAEDAQDFMALVATWLVLAATLSRVAGRRCGHMNIADRTKTSEAARPAMRTTIGCRRGCT